jgi:hypothetical protein
MTCEMALLIKDIFASTKAIQFPANPGKHDLGNHKVLQKAVLEVFRSFQYGIQRCEASYSRSGCVSKAADDIDAHNSHLWSFLILFGLLVNLQRAVVDCARTSSISFQFMRQSCHTFSSRNGFNDSRLPRIWKNHT